MTFLTLVDDAELRAEIRAILARLEFLSDTSAAAPGRSSRSSETPLGPPGFAGLSEKDCPPEERSLYEHFRYRFEKAIDSGATRKTLYFLLWEAEKALRLRVIGPDPDRKALVLTRADEEALIRRVLTDYEGEHSYRVYLDLDLPQGWIEKIREDDGREPETGFRRPKWKDLDEALKRSLVSDLRAAGKTQAETARWLGVSRRTVVTYSTSRAA
jgi:hypothetical protein